VHLRRSKIPDLATALQPVADASSAIADLNLTGSELQSALEATACALEGINAEALERAFQSLETDLNAASQTSIAPAQIGASIQALQDAGARLLEAIDLKDLDPAVRYLIEASQAAESLAVRVQAPALHLAAPILAKRAAAGEDPPTTSALATEAPLPKQRTIPEVLIDDYLNAHPEIPNHDALAEKIDVSRDVLFAIKGESRWVRPLAYQSTADLIGCTEQDLHPHLLTRRRRKGKSSSKPDSKSDA